MGQLDLPRNLSDQFGRVILAEMERAKGKALELAATHRENVLALARIVVVRRRRSDRELDEALRTAGVEPAAQRPAENAVARPRLSSFANILRVATIARSTRAALSTALLTLVLGACGGASPSAAPVSMPTVTPTPAATPASTLWRLSQMTALLEAKGVMEVDKPAASDATWLGDPPSGGRVVIRGPAERTQSIVINWVSTEQEDGMLDYIVTTWGGEEASAWIVAQLAGFVPGTDLKVNKKFTGPDGPVTVNLNAINGPGLVLHLAEVARDLDPGESLPTPGATAAWGSWIVWGIKTDPITDKKTANTTLFSEEGPGLGIRCDNEGKTELAINWFESVGSGPTVEWRVDDEAAQTGRWASSTTGQATFYPSFGVTELTDFIESMFGRSRLLVRVTPNGGSSKLATFDITGIEAAMANVREACAW